MDKSSKERWLKDCERCQGDTRIVLKILRGARALRIKKTVD